jgi:hypothetical protein
VSVSATGLLLPHGGSAVIAGDRNDFVLGRMGPRVSLVSPDAVVAITPGHEQMRGYPYAATVSVAMTRSV